MSTHMDPQLWDQPHQFNPSRVLDESGSSLRETQHFFPFSLGKRVCLGESLAKVELFLFFITLVKNFQFLPAKNHPLPDPAECDIGITRIPKPFHCMVVERTS